MKAEIGVPDRGYVAFDHYSNKYKCCCRSVHVKQGAYIIGILSAISVLFGLITAIFGTESFKVFEITSLVLEAACLVAFFYGLKHNNDVFLIPFAIYMLLSCLLLIVMAAISIFVAIDPESSIGKHLQEKLLPSPEKDSELNNPEFKGDLVIRLTATILVTSIFLALFITGWFLRVIIKCMRYFRDLVKHHDNEASIRYVV